MSKVKDGNYVVIQSFMVKELKLKGNELLIYAIIYGFSQNEQKFSGSLQYLADWTNCSKQSVLNNLKTLCGKGLIQKTEIEKNSVKFCEYRAKEIDGIQESLTPGQKSLTGGIQKSLTGGIQKSLPNNLSNNNLSSDNKEDNRGSAAPAAPAVDYGLFQSVYNSCKNLPSVRVMTEKRKKAIRLFLKEFTVEQFKEICEKADRSSFLTGKNDRGWKADLDFLLRADKAAKVLEGGYEDKQEPQKFDRNNPDYEHDDPSGYFGLEGF